MTDGLTDTAWPPGAHLHVVVDDDGQRHVARTVRHGRRNATDVVEGSQHGVQRAGRHSWQVPVTGFWQAHRADLESVARAQGVAPEYIVAILENLLGVYVIGTEMRMSVVQANIPVPPGGRDIEDLAAQIDAHGVAP